MELELRPRLIVLALRWALGWRGAGRTTSYGLGPTLLVPPYFCCAAEEQSGDRRGEWLLLVPSDTDELDCRLAGREGKCRSPIGHSRFASQADRPCPASASSAPASIRAEGPRHWLGSLVWVKVGR